MISDDSQMKLIGTRGTIEADGRQIEGPGRYQQFVLYDRVLGARINKRRLIHQLNKSFKHRMKELDLRKHDKNFDHININLKG
jgi:hypothetical protein